MSLRSTATLNWPLTTFAQGYMQDRLAVYRLANLLCPIVQVSAATGTFKKFDERNAFLPVETERPIGGPRTRMAVDASDGTYNCKPHGIEVPLDDFEEALAGPAGSVAAELLMQGKIKAMLSKKATAYGKRVVDYVVANLTAVSNRGNWSNDTIDPIDQIDEQLENLANVVGTTENINVVMSLGVWRKVRANAKVKSRIAGIKRELTRDEFAGTLLYPVGVETSAAVATSSKRGATTVTKTSLVGDYCIICHSVPSPTTEDASAFKCFSTSSVLVESVKQYRDEASASDIAAIDWSEAITQTGAACAILIAIT